MGRLSTTECTYLPTCVCVYPPPPMVGHAVLVCAPPQWWGVLRWFVVPLMVGLAVLVRAPPHGWVCCVGACPPRWWFVVWWCLAWVVVLCSVRCGCGCVVCLAGVGAVLVRGAPPVWACPVCACPPPWCGLLCRRVRVSVRGVVAGSMLGLFCWFAVVSAAVRPAMSAVGCLWCLPGRGRCCAGACPFPHVLGRAVFVRSPPHRGACSVGVCPPPWRGVLRWFVALLLVGRAVWVRGPPLGGACCVGACPPQC